MADHANGPSVTSDPRFRAGRTLVTTGRAGEGAIGMFATLVEESRQKYGDSTIESAACYYEYGNALFRAACREAEDTAETPTTSAAAAAAAAEKRVASSSLLVTPSTVPSSKSLKPDSTTSSSSGKDIIKTDPGEEKDPVEIKITAPIGTSKIIKNEEDGNEENFKLGRGESQIMEDVQLALEQMETAWSILDKHVSPEDESSLSSAPVPQSPPLYLDWAKNQLPRILLGIGDVLSFLGQNADAVDAYTRAIPHREAAVQQQQQQQLPETVDFLARRRHLAEAFLLVAQELLTCPEGEDVVTSESNVLLVKSTERVDFARGYYDKARDELQEAVFLMGKIASSGQDLKTEKEDVCFLATMLMGIGNTLADLDEAASASSMKPSSSKKLKIAK